MDLCQNKTCNQFINTVDIEAVEKNAPDEISGDEKIPNEEKKGKSPKN